MQSLVGQRVRVHFNLHKHTWSITALAGPEKGRVIANVGDVTLESVTFHVSVSGRARSQRLGKRTVHAWVSGVVTEVDSKPDISGLIKVTYNPAIGRADTFTDVNGNAISTADHVVFANAPDNPNKGYGWI